MNLLRDLEQLKLLRFRISKRNLFFIGREFAVVSRRMT